MILVAGGSGRLGSALVDRLVARDLGVRILTRDPTRVRTGTTVDVVQGDVRDVAAVQRAVDGVDTVVSAIQGFAGSKGVSPTAVDRDGNYNLIHAAAAAGVNHFVLTSVWDARPTHAVELMRMKYAAEQELRASGVPWTIIRPTAYMETWCEVLGRPLLAKGRTKVFGTGRNPINWVSMFDVAHIEELAIVESVGRGEVIEVGGPEDLSMLEFVDVFQQGAGVNGKVGRIPPLAMRVAAAVMTVANAALARQIRAGISMDTDPMAFDAAAVRQRYPSVPSTRLLDVVRRDFAPHGTNAAPRAAASV